MPVAIAIIGLIVIVVGIVAMVIGLYVSLSDRKKRSRGEFKTEALGTADTINALSRFLDALRGYPLGQQLFFGGLVVVGAGLCAIAGITTAVAGS